MKQTMIVILGKASELTKGEGGQFTEDFWSGPRGAPQRPPYP